MKPVLVDSSYPDELLCSVLLPGEMLEPVSLCSTFCIALLFRGGVCVSVFLLPLVVRGHWSSLVPGERYLSTEQPCCFCNHINVSWYGQRDVEHWKILCDTVDGCYKSVCLFNPYHRKWLFIPVFYFLCSLLKKSKRSANESGEEHSAKYSNSNNSGNYKERNLLLHSCFGFFFFFISVIFCLKRFGIIWDYIIIWDIWLPKSGTTVFNNKYSEGLKISLLLYFQLPNLK